ncbi:MAG: TonB-dependent receptor [Thermoanaerobaculia bacterium]
MSALLALVLAVAGGFSNVAFAQTTGDIDGSVMDQNGSPLPGVSVEIKSASLIGTRVVVTDGAGRFRFPALSPGNYSLTAALSGFSKAEKSSVVVKLGGTTSIPVTLGVSVKEEVIVTGEAPAVDTQRTTIGTNASLDTIQKLPLGRNFTSIATTVAGTGTDVSGGITVYGATGLENSYIVDGVNTTGVKVGDQGKTLNNEFVQEVEVKTGGYEAEYGRVLGGTINVVTKSGGNEFHGDAFGYYDNASLAADDAHSAQRTDVGLAQFFTPKRLDVGADIGGYFVKDRLWFFGAYDRVNQDQEYVRTIRTIRDAAKTKVTQGGTDLTRNNLYSGKLTFRLGEANTITASAFGDPGTFDGRLLGTIGPDSAVLGTQDQGGADFSLKYDGIFGTRLLVQAQFGSHTDKRDQSSAFVNSLYREQSQAGFSTEALPGSGPGIILNEKYTRNIYKLAGTVFAGANEVKLGLDWEKIDSKFLEQYGGGDRLTLRLNATGTVVRNVQHRYFAVTPIDQNCIAKNDPALPFSIANCSGYRIAPNVSNNPKTDNIGFFAQDSFKVLKNLTINAGIRYENQKLKDFTGATIIDIKNEWSPRLGVIWDFMNNGKSKLYANYGRFYEVIPQDIQTRALGDEYTMFVRNNSQNAADPVDAGIFGYAVVQGGELTQEGLKGMYQDEVIGGIEYEVAPNWAIGVKGIYKALGRVVEDRCDVATNVDISQFYTPGSSATCALVNVGEGNALGTIKDPFDPNCYTVLGDASSTPKPCASTQARRYFRGLEVTATHRFSSNFYMLASYLYSKLQGNYSGNLSQTREGGQADPNINADFDYPGLVPNTFGLLRNDRTSQFKVSGFYSFAFGLSAGANFHYESGRPYSIRGCALEAGACGGGYSQEGYLVPRGSAGNLPSTAEMDLHLEYSARFGGVSITPIIDVFNLLNRQGVTSREELFNNGGTLAGDNPANVVTQQNPTACATNVSITNPACGSNPNYGKDIAFQRPRSLRIGARVSF